MRASRPLRRRLSRTWSPALATPMAMPSRSQAASTRPSARVPVKSMSDIPSASSTSTRTSGTPASAPTTSSRKCGRVGVPERGGEEEDEDAGDHFGVGIGRTRRPTGGARNATRARGAAGGRSSRIRSRMASPTATPIPCSTPTRATVKSVMAARPNSKRSKRSMAARFAPVEEPDRDEDQDGGQRRQGNVLQDVRERDEDDHRRCGAEWARLGPAARGGDGAGAGRAGVHRERPHEPRHHVAGADGEEVAPGVDVVAALVGEGPGRRRGLGHDDEAHHGSQRRQTPQRRPREPGRARSGALPS